MKKNCTYIPTRHIFLLLLQVGDGDDYGSGGGGGGDDDDHDEDRCSFRRGQKPLLAMPKINPCRTFLLPTFSPKNILLLFVK